MVAGFRRTISFPAPTLGPPRSAARSASLPCRFHPLVLQLDDDVADLRALLQEPSEPAPSVADQLGRVLVSLSDLLHHPQAQDPLRRLGRSPLADRLLDDFLRLADAHGTFRDALVSLAALQAEARAALRREDPARLASAARALRRSARDLPRIASAARAVAAKAPKPPPADLPADAAAIAAAVVDAAAAVASASAAVFSAVSCLSVAAATARVEVEPTTPCWMPSPARFAATPSATPRHSTRPRPRIWWVADLMRWMSRAKRRSRQQQRHHHQGTKPSDPEEELERKAAAFERLDSLGRCIADVESSGDRVFRALVNTRVSLLNILAPPAF
ncbi:unnamed protein product [Urochloa decumbens]|uniref:Uncharacterized protein n=1 Tax=Urochloa decumbens TaxID=240449 RepID=A0ABC8V7D8_9POAL